MCQSSFREILDQAQGQAVHDYVATHQDRSRNALAKSVQAAFNSWCEDLKADQAQFVSEKLLWPGSGRCASSYPSSTNQQLTAIKLQFFSVINNDQVSSMISSAIKGRERSCQSTHKAGPTAGGPIELCQSHRPYHPIKNLFGNVST